MTTLDAIILGIVQGVTEFLPISSSGHLHLFEYFLGFTDLDLYLPFDIACHLGSLVAIIIIFFRQLIALFTENKNRLFQLLIAILPLFPLVIVIKSIKAIYADPSYLGFFFILTALFLFLGERFGFEKTIEERQYHRWRDALVIGLWQAIAIFPGISRSGSTISGARLLGWDMKAAITFSFLLAIPTILGATTVEAMNWYKHPNNVADLAIEHYLVGFFTSLLTGLASLKILFYIALSNKFYYFAWYCLLLGITVTCYFYL